MNEEMGNRFAAGASAFLLATALTASAFADETAEPAGPALAPADDGPPTHVRFETDRGGSGWIVATGGVVLVLAAFYDGLTRRNPDPDRNRSRPDPDASRVNTELSIGLGLVVVGLASLIVAVATPNNDFAVERKAPMTARRPTWRDAQTPGVAKPMSANVLSLHF